MVEMELSVSELGLTVQSGEHCLFACGQRKKLFAIPGESLHRPRFIFTLLYFMYRFCPFLACASPNSSVKPLCFVYGIVGRLSLNFDSESYLLVISRRSFVGKHPVDQSSIYKITQVNAIPFHSSALKNMDASSSKFLDSTLPVVDKSRIFSLQTSRDFVKLASSSLKEAIADQIIGTSPSFISKKIGKYDEKMDNSSNLLEEILRLFNEDCCFYVSDTDLTSQLDKISVGHIFDERFFWNKHLLNDLLECGSDECKFWIRPVIQGFIEFKTIDIRLLNNSVLTGACTDGSCEIALISRRCVRRAGTRYLKRGVDSQGFCANYVETEQILSIMGHVLSFIQIRASIPLFWRQLGFKYKPPPLLYNSKSENQSALENHFYGLFSSYDTIGQSVIVVNLIDQVGREKILGDAYIDHVLDYNSDKLTYVAFDFHDHCRGLKFENVNTLINALSPEFKAARFSWIDRKREFICRQNALFRVNCVDCLDRTNVVQAAFALHVFDCQIRKLGLLTPDESLSSKCKTVLQGLWADNGDAISRQYSGTAALKGDFTRTGQRKLVGILKDGYNSASRYYMCHLRDRNRQKAIDTVLGNATHVDEKIDLKAIEGEQNHQDSEWHYQKDEQISQLMEDCLKAFLPAEETLLGCWPLVDVCDLLPQDGVFTDEYLRILDADDNEMNIILILTQSCIYFVKYNENEDDFDYCRKVNIDQLMSVEMGKFVVRENKGILRKGERFTKAPYLRIFYSIGEHQDYCFILKSAGIRIFNNISIAVQSPDEFEEYTNSIFEQIRNTIWLKDLGAKISVVKSATLEFKKFSVCPSDDLPMENLLDISASDIDFVTSPVDVNLIQLDDLDNSEVNDNGTVRDRTLTLPNSTNSTLKTSRSENFLKNYKNKQLSSTNENLGVQEKSAIKASSSSNQFLDKVSDSKRLIKSMGQVISGSRAKNTPSSDSLIIKYSARIKTSRTKFILL